MSLSCLSHFGLSLKLMMVCLLCFFCLVCWAGSSYGLQSVMLACLHACSSLSERLGGRQRNTGSVFFSLCLMLDAAPP